jgi:hypothetical protein
LRLLSRCQGRRRGVQGCYQGVRPLSRCQGRRRSVTAVVQVLRLLSRCDAAVKVSTPLSKC